ncbi:MAG: flippase-like domain-containing protein [Deltaproteobacteria bacterium]|nr:flippase-like domain-containing protein [Deltaproteobacteria bacterium]
MSGPGSGRLRWALRAAQAAWFVAVVVYAGHFAATRWAEFRAQPWRVGASWLALALVLSLLRRLLGALRWMLLARFGRGPAAPGESLPFLRAYFLSNLAAYVPGSVWYIPSRIHLSRATGMTALHSSAAIAYEMGLLVWTGLLLSAYCLALKIGASPGGGAGVLATAAALSAVPLYPRAASWAARTLLRLLRRPRDLAAVPARWAASVWLASVGVWACSGLSLLALLKGLDPAVPGSRALFVTSAAAAAWSAGFLAPWAPSGLGVREGMLAWLLEGLAAGPVIAVAVVGARLLTILEDVVWALVALFLPEGRSRDAAVRSSD